MASFISEAAIKLHYRVFLIPWAKRNTKLSCTKERNYSSSVPVKYIPKKSSTGQDNEEKNQNGLKFNELRANQFDNLRTSCLDVESRNRGREDGFNTLDFEAEEETGGDFMAVNDEFIEEVDELFEDDSNKRGLGIQTVGIRLDVEKSATELLAARAFTAQELKKKLQGKKFPVEVVDDVITDFQSRGLINDSLYAETYSRSRWSSSSWGPRRIKQALFKKGVSEVDTDRAIKLVFENLEASEDHDSGIAMSKLSFGQLYIQASKQWLRSNGVPQETRKSRIVRWLQYRGFNWNVIKPVLKKLESECPS